MRFADESYEFYRLGRHLGRTFTGTDRNGEPNYCISLDCAGCIAAIADLISFLSKCHDYVQRKNP